MNGKKFAIILILSGLMALSLIGCNFISIGTEGDSSGSDGAATATPGQPPGGG
ncbi:MAG: hypothetical protein PVF83_13595 [Anaerolineales bacterium]